MQSHCAYIPTGRFDGLPPRWPDQGPGFRSDASACAMSASSLECDTLVRLCAFFQDCPGSAPSQHRTTQYEGEGRARFSFPLPGRAPRFLLSAAAGPCRPPDGESRHAQPFSIATAGRHPVVPFSHPRRMRLACGWRDKVVPDALSNRARPGSRRMQGVGGSRPWPAWASIRDRVLSHR